MMIFLDFETTGLPVHCQRDNQLSTDDKNNLTQKRNQALINFNCGRIAESIAQYTDANGNNVEVLSLTVAVTDQDMNVTESHTRYYYHTLPVEMIGSTLAVNKLTHDQVNNLRAAQGANYPITYIDDIMFWHDLFIRLEAEGEKVIYAHNMEFDKLFLSVGLYHKFNFQCSMIAAMLFFEVKKYITLERCCRLFNLSFDQELAHGSKYDVARLIEVVRAIKNNKVYRKIVSMSHPEQKKSSLNNYKIMVEFSGHDGKVHERLVLISAAQAFALITAKKISENAITYKYVASDPRSHILELTDVNPYLSLLQDFKLI